MPVLLDRFQKMISGQDGREKAPPASLASRLCFLSLLVFWFSLTFSNALAEISFTAALIFFAADIFKERRLPLAKLNKAQAAAFLLYTVIASASYFWSEAPHESFRGVFKVLQQSLLFVMTLDVLSRRRLGTFEKVLAAVFIITIINCFVQYFFNWDFLRGHPYAGSNAGKRITSSFKTYGQLACFLILSIPYIAGIAMEQKRYSVRQILYFSFVLLALLCLFWTRSRGAMCAFGTGILVLALTKKNMSVIYILFAIIGAVITFMPSSMLIHFDINNKEQSLIERFYLWDRAAHVIRAKPFTGTGINTYLSTHAKYDQTQSWRVTDYYAHNGYLQMGAEIGIPGAAVFLFFITSGLWLSWRALHSKRIKSLNWPMLGLWTGALNFFTFAAVDTALHSMQSVLAFWYLFGTLFAYMYILKTSQVPDAKKAPE